MMNREKTAAISTPCTKCTQSLRNQFKTGRIPVIPDIKCKSPGEGDLIAGRDPAVLAKSLEAAGAAVISVVTEAGHYGGSPELLYTIARAVSVPILRKDFITSREQLLESVGIGASGVLLIASMLEKKQLFTLIEASLELGLEPLVETHNEAEIISANEWNLTFLGINNRNIIQWETDDGNVQTTAKLAGLVCQGPFILSESAIASPEDVGHAIAAGAHGVLVGTAILKAQDPIEMYYQLSSIRKPGG